MDRPFEKRNLTNLDLDPAAVSAWIRELDRRLTALERVAEMPPRTYPDAVAEAAKAVPPRATERKEG